MPLEVQEENDSQIECYPQVLSSIEFYLHETRSKITFSPVKSQKIKNVPATHSFRELIRMPQMEEKEIPMSKSKKNSYSIKESPRIILNCRPKEKNRIGRWRVPEGKPSRRKKLIDSNYPACLTLLKRVSPIWL